MIGLIDKSYSEDTKCPLMIRRSYEQVKIIGVLTASCGGVLALSKNLEKTSIFLREE